MKRVVLSTFLTICLFGITQKVYADGMPYEPVFESAPITETSSQVSTVNDTTQAATQLQGSVEDANKLQNALLQLDSAQVDIRNNLVQYKNEYAEIDSQYKAIKAQRKAKMQQIKNTEKRIKTLDKTKDKIRKSM